MTTSHTMRATVRPRNRDRRATGWLRYISILPASSSEAVNPFAAATAATARSKRHDELVQIAPEEAGGGAESGEPECIDDTGGSWSMASLMPEDPRNAGQKATVDGDERPEPDRPAEK